MYLLEPDLFNTINFVSSGVSCIEQVKQTISRQLISLPNWFFHFMLNTDIVLSGFYYFVLFRGVIGEEVCFRPVLLSRGVMGEEVCFRPFLLSHGVMGEEVCFRPVLWCCGGGILFSACPVPWCHGGSIWPVLLSHGVMGEAFCFWPVLLSCGVMEEAFCFWPGLLSQKFVSTTRLTFWLGILNYIS